VQRFTIELGRLDDRHPARRHGHERGGSLTALEVCPLPEQRARPVLGEPAAVLLDAQHAVEQQEDLRAGLSLPHQRRACLQPADGRL